ncbi:hypothetical protein K402DRAFT_309803, partial [Aulographum hederae CBS 113979]
SKKLPDPEPFTGKYKELPTFLRKMSIKLKANANRFLDQRRAFLYFVSRIPEDAMKTLDPVLDKEV